MKKEMFTCDMCADKIVSKDKCFILQIPRKNITRIKVTDRGTCADYDEVAYSIIETHLCKHCGDKVADMFPVAKTTRWYNEHNREKENKNEG